MNFNNAIMRKPGEDFAEGITGGSLGAPDYARMLEQHAKYVQVFQQIGVETRVLDPLAGFPDAYFVEDAAVMLPEAAVIARPGAAARRGEEAALEPVLAEFRPLERILPGGTLDGGDVLMTERQFFIGISERTNREGAIQLGRIGEKHGFKWTVVPLQGEGLHLKSDVSWVDGKTLVISPALSRRKEFDGWEFIIRPDEEKQAANLLRVNDHILMPDGCPETRRMLERLGLPVIVIDASEAHKMDGGLSCMSLRF
jgi:dimethylargininase